MIDVYVISITRARRRSNILGRDAHAASLHFAVERRAFPIYRILFSHDHVRGDSSNRLSLSTYLIFQCDILVFAGTIRLLHNPSNATAGGAEL